MRRIIADQIDALDASVFSGDMLENDGERQSLKEHCERWLRAIADAERVAEFEEADSDFQGEDE